MGEKRYYWIKLRKDFLTGDAVDFLMGQKQGANYVVLYLMLCMMCIHTDGVMATQVGEMVIPYDIDKIQRDCKYFGRDTVRVALELYKKLGLVYADENGTACITDYDQIVGSESAVASRVRRFRNNQRATQQALHCNAHGNANATQQALQSSNNVTPNVTTEIDIEIRDRDQSSELDTEKEKERPLRVSDETLRHTDSVRRVLKAWNSLSGLGIKPVSRIAQGTNRYKQLIARLNQYGEEDVLKAVEKIRNSDFLQGKGTRGWTIYFDWFVKPNNFPKVLEGNYDNDNRRSGDFADMNEWRDAIDVVRRHSNAAGED